METKKHVHRTCSGGIYCADCGATLKEKCLKCGQMEPIGRRVCETDLIKAKNALREYLWPVQRVISVGVVLNIIVPTIFFWVYSFL